MLCFRIKFYQVPKNLDVELQSKGELSLGIDVERNDVTESDSVVPYNPYPGLSFDEQRLKLPIYKYRNHILYLMERYQTVIILGQTGCGKSTQVPQYLMEAGWAGGGKIIGVTQPRRVAATMLATRVAEERDVCLGKEVGYSIRFDDCCTEKVTKIKYLTEGTLINEMMSDPLLSAYSVLMLDEVHERNLNQDIVLGLLKKIIKKRSDLKLIVSSATFEAETFYKFLNRNETNDKSQDTAVIISIEGRSYPVTVHYSVEPVAHYVKASVETAIKIHQSEIPGDVLIFLTGQEEVEQATTMLIDYATELKGKDDSKKIYVVPLYAALPMSEQLKAFRPVSRNVRKIVVATNLAEASVTISGITYVIDSCFVKLRYFNPHSCTDSLVVVPVSQASAEQRAGRAGRIRSGKAYRLCTEDDFSKLALYTVPEMQRSNLAPVILQLKALGIENILRFNFPAAPPSKHVISALELLFALGAIDEQGRLTEPLGNQMAEFPLNPLFSKMVLVSGEFGCCNEALTIAAMLQVQNVFVSPAGRRNDAKKEKWKFSVEEGDFITYLNVYNAFVQNHKSKQWCLQHFLNYKSLSRAIEIRSQLSRILSRFKIPSVSTKGDTESVLKCIVSAFFANAAYLHYSGVYKTIRGEHTLHIHPESTLYFVKQPQWVVFNEVLHTTKEYMRDVTAINPKWLYELAPHYYQYGTDRETDDLPLL